GLWILALRRWLGRVGTPVALAFYLVAGTLMYYQRFFRNDALFVFTTLWIVASAAHWWQSRRPGWLVSLVLAVVVLFSNKESCLFVYFALATYMAMVMIHDLAKGWLDGPQAKEGTEQPHGTGVPPPRPWLLGSALFLTVFLVWTQVFEGIRFDAEVVEAIGRDF